MSDTTPPEPAPVVLEICGEGKTDIGASDVAPVPATGGVIPVLVRRLCVEPTTLRVKRKKYDFLQGKGQRWQKVWFFKRNASINGADGCVFVLDSEGDLPGVQEELERGRSHGYPDFPMAIGVAHPCIEAWLLSDASAVRQGLNITGARPVVPTAPETLPAPQQDRRHNPKTVLDALHPNRNDVNATEKTAIAERIVFPVAESRCPSFLAFAVDVRKRITATLFRPAPPPEPNDEITPPV